METVLTLTQLIDACFGSATPGVIDFELLKRTFHEFAQRLNVHEAKVRLDGDYNARVRRLLSERADDSSIDLEQSVLDLTQTVVAPFLDKTPSERSNKRGSEKALAPRKDSRFNVTKRLEAAERKIQQLEGLIEDAVGVASVRHVGDQTSDEFSTEQELGHVEFPSKLSGRESRDAVRRELQALRAAIFGDSSADADEDASVPARLARLEAAHRDVRRNVASLNDATDEQMALAQAQIGALERDFAIMNEKMYEMSPSGGKHPLVALADRLDVVEHDLSNVCRVAAKLMEKERESDARLGAFVAHLDALKIDKIGRNEFDDALHEKVDRCVLERKVSRERFEDAYENIARNFAEAATRNDERHHNIEDALASLRDDIDEKPNRADVDEVARVVEETERNLRNEMAEMRPVKEEREAAGTRLKLLRDVQCVSCASDVVMRKTNDVTVKAPASIARTVNRYCGGSHTAQLARRATITRVLPPIDDATSQSVLMTLPQMSLKTLLPNR